MKAKVQLTDTYTGRSINIIVNLINYEFDKYGFSFETLTDNQRRKIENYFGKLNAYYTKSEIIKYYNNYRYYRVIQSNFGTGWNDEVKYETRDPKEMEEYKSDIRDYRQNARENGYRIRVINRRVQA